MSRIPLSLATLVLFSMASVWAQQDGIFKGKVAKIDADKPAVTVTKDGKDKEYLILDSTRVFGAEKETTIKDRLKTLKVGGDVLFKPAERDGKDILVGIKPLLPGEIGPRPGMVKYDSSKLKPLTDLSADKYQGHDMGLYPGVKNERPAGHEKAGLELARAVKPLSANGKPDPAGKIVMLSVGMSNTSQVSGAFGQLLAKDRERNPSVVFVNGAQGGMTAARIQDPDDNKSGTQYWTVVDQKLKESGVSREQVQVIWIKEADAGPSSGFPKYAKTLQEELARIVQIFPKRFPNAKLVYLSGRTFAGYATTGLNPEPYAYESGLSVRWLIEDQLKGDAALNFDAAKGAVKAPWLSWGPYLWANGKTQNSDGLSYDPEDFSGDGTHPSPAGQRKVAETMLRFFKNDSTTRPWFLAKE